MGLTSEMCTNSTHNNTDSYIQAIWHWHLFNNFGEKSLSIFLGCHIPLSPLLRFLVATSTTNLKKANGKLLIIALSPRKPSSWPGNQRPTQAFHNQNNVLIDKISAENVSASVQWTFSFLLFSFLFFSFLFIYFASKTIIIYIHTYWKQTHQYTQTKPKITNNYISDFIIWWWQWQWLTMLLLLILLWFLLIFCLV